MLIATERLVALFGVHGSGLVCCLMKGFQENTRVVQKKNRRKKNNKSERTVDANADISLL